MGVVRLGTLRATEQYYTSGNISGLLWDFARLYKRNFYSPSCLFIKSFFYSSARCLTLDLPRVAIIPLLLSTA